MLATILDRIINDFSREREREKERVLNCEYFEFLGRRTREAKEHEGAKGKGGEEGGC